MELSELVEGVVLRTKRPDKTTLIVGLINKSIKEFCRLKKFGKDLVHHEWYIPPANAGETILFLSWEDLPSEVRELELVRGINDGCALDEVASNQTLFRGRPLKGVYYESAMGIHLSLRMATDTVLFTYYGFPEKLKEPYDTNWVARLVGDAIVERATSHLFRSVGNDREADRLFQSSVMEYERAMRDIR